MEDKQLPNYVNVTATSSKSKLDNLNVCRMASKRI